MKLILKRSLKMANVHKLILLYLCLYQTAWAYLLFRLMNHLLDPIVRSYPDVANQSNAASLFMLEMKFHLLKTDMVWPYLYGFLALLFLRMIITPFIQSGLYYSIANSAQEPTHTAFKEGLRLKWKVMNACYWVKNLLIFTPLIVYLLPFIKQLSNSSALIDWSALFSLRLLFIVLWIIVVESVVYCVQLGLASQCSIMKMLQTSVKRSVKLAAVSMTILLLGLLLQAVIHTSTIMWYSFFTMLLYQLLPAIRTFIKVWLISSHIQTIQP